ncbi:MAG: hypothetical protein IPN99_09855 [Bacteroidetes bacterium]|nr:hypothetical protein [Bacteroidota bacterium]
MSTWFEQNQTKSVIIYTALISATTWGFYKFIYEENKLDLYKAQIETKQSVIGQYQSRIDFLEKENSKLQVVLNDFEEWNSKSKDPTLFYKTKFEEIADLKKEFTQKKALNDTVIVADNSSGQNPPEAPELKLPINFEISKGRTYVNDLGKIVIGLNNVHVDQDADFTLSIGNKKNITYENIKVGSSFSFIIFNNKKIAIVLSQTDFISGSARFHINQE